MSDPAILRREGALWVLSKPAGFAAHPTGDPTIPDVITWAITSAGAPADLAPVHRLDRETSGVLLASDDAALRARLGALFAAPAGEGAVIKRYRALVHGRTNAKGVVRRALVDGRRGRPVEAVTRYRRLAIYGRVSLLEVRPETGRKHQIRRHLAGLGHPIVGDARYGPRRPAPVAGYPGRLWLHAASVELEGSVFEAPLPEELAAHLTLLEERFGAR